MKNKNKIIIILFFICFFLKIIRSEKTCYISDTLGNDMTNNGTILFPYKSFLKAKMSNCQIWHIDVQSEYKD